MPFRFEAQAFADAAAEKFLSGEKYHQHVINEINKLPKKQAMAATAFTVEILLREHLPLAAKFQELLRHGT
jgi:hypothetical protein